MVNGRVVVLEREVRALAGLVEALVARLAELEERVKVLEEGPR